MLFVIIKRPLTVIRHFFPVKFMATNNLWSLFVYFTVHFWAIGSNSSPKGKVNEFHLMQPFIYSWMDQLTLMRSTYRFHLFYVLDWNSSTRTRTHIIIIATDEMKSIFIEFPLSDVCKKSRLRTIIIHIQLTTNSPEFNQKLHCL